MESSAAPSSNSPVQLHVVHNWGGGTEVWVKDYCRTDNRKNLILKPAGAPSKVFQHLELYEHISDTKPVRSWKLSTPIYGTAINNADYSYILDEIIQTFSVQVICISSFIGHSLNLLQTNLRTIIVCHDYYPFCTASIIYFNKACTDCEFSRLQKCFEGNSFNHFPEIGASFWMNLRQVFIASVLQPQVSLVIPSASVQKNLICLSPQLKNARFAIIPHGVELPIPFAMHSLRISSNQLAHKTELEITSNPPKLKILVLGRLDAHKGLALLQGISPQIGDIADVLLLGCGEESSRIFSEYPGIQVVADHYARVELSSKLAEIAPDLCLFLSIWPETFCYTLSEAMMLGIPPLAPDIGSFSDRIIDQKNGFLVEPSQQAVIQKIHELSQNRELLRAVATYIRNQPQNSLQWMIDAYHQLISTAELTSFRPRHKRNPSQHLLQEIDELYSQLRISNQAVADSQARLQQNESRIEQIQHALEQATAAQAHTQHALEQATAAQAHTQHALEQATAAQAHTQHMLEQTNAVVRWMESSRFWKLRQIWLRLRQLFSLQKSS